MTVRLKRGKRALWTDWSMSIFYHVGTNTMFTHGEHSKVWQGSIWPGTALIRVHTPNKVLLATTSYFIYIQHRRVEFHHVVWSLKMALNIHPLSVSFSRFLLSLQSSSSTSFQNSLRWRESRKKPRLMLILSVFLVLCPLPRRMWVKPRYCNYKWCY